MRYMLDTNTCSYIIKHRPLDVLSKFQTLAIDDCCMSSITYAELKYWVARNKRLHLKSNNPGAPKINEQIIHSFTSHLDIVEFDAHAADIYAKNRDHIEEKGVTVGTADLFIGSHAISLNLTLVTNNTKDFMHLPHIQLENWVTNSKSKQ